MHCSCWMCCCAIVRLDQVWPPGCETVMFYEQLDVQEGFAFQSDVDFRSCVAKVITSGKQIITITDVTLPSATLHFDQPASFFLALVGPGHSKSAPNPNNTQHLQCRKHNFSTYPDTGFRPDPSNNIRSV